MKKFIIALLAVAIIATILVFPAFAADDVTVLVNGTAVSFDQPPVIVSGRTLVPARAVFEFIGASVYWDETANGGYVSVVTNNTSVVLEVNRENPVSYMTVDNIIKVALDVPASVISGRTLVPLRAIGDALSCKVGWDGETRTATVDYIMPEADKLSSEINTANTNFSYSKAEADCEQLYGFNPLEEMPVYKNGLKRYEGISVEKEKKYINEAGKTPVYEDFKIFATVDDMIISWSEYEYYMKMYSDAEGNITDEYKEIALNDALNTAITANYAKKSGVEFNNELISATDYYLYNICYGMNLKTYASMVGSTPEVVYEIAEKYAFRNSLYSFAVNNGEIDTSDEAVNAKFEELFYKAKHILFKTVDDNMQPLSKSEIAKKKKLAENTLNKLKKGVDFDKLMKELSEDGEQSFEGYVFTDGQMVSSFENGVKELEFNEISDVIESEYGYHIILRMELAAENEAAIVAQYKTAIQNYLGTEYFGASVENWAKNMNVKIY